MDYISKAKKFLHLAKQEFIRANGDEEKTRQAAEKGWLAAVLATNHIFYKGGMKLPRDTKKRQDVLHKLGEKDKKIKELRLYEMYTTFLHNLHVDCFYDGDVSVKRVERDLNKVNEYIEIIEKI